MAHSAHVIVSAGFMSCAQFALLFTRARCSMHEKKICRQLYNNIVRAVGSAASSFVVCPLSNPS